MDLKISYEAKVMEHKQRFKLIFSSKWSNGQFFYLVLAHVQPDEPLLVALVEVVGDLLGQLRLPDSGRPEKEEDKRMLVVDPSVLLPANGRRDDRDGPVLKLKLSLKFPISITSAKKQLLAGLCCRWLATPQDVQAVGLIAGD